MKVIYPNGISDTPGTCTLSNEHADFPATNVLSSYVGDKAKSNDNTDTITISVDSGDNAQACAFFGCNIDTVNSFTVNGVDHSGQLQMIPGDNGYNTIYCPYLATYTTSHNIVANLKATTTNLEIGKIWAGPFLTGTFNDPQYGATETFFDNSIIHTLNSGATYVQKRQVGRIFNFSFDIVRDSDFYAFLRDFYQRNGALPCVFVLNETLTNADWVIFGLMDSVPSGSHAYFSHSVISMSIREQL
jgi:hypothetical protein